MRRRIVARRGNSAAAAAIALLIALWPSSGDAHQLAGSLGVISDAGGELWAVRLPAGIAILDEEARWRWVCPAAWGGPDAPLSRWLYPSILLVAASGPYAMAQTGIVESRGSVQVNAGNTVDLEVLDDVVLALALNASRSTVVAFDAAGARTIVTSTSPIQSVEADTEDLLVGSSTTGGVWIARYELDGTRRERFFVSYAESADSMVELERVGDELYGLFTSAFGFRIARLEEDSGRTLATAFTPILGPVRIEEDALIVIDGVLSRLTLDGMEVVDQSQPYTCLEEGQERVYACTARVIYAVGREAALEPMFDLSDLKGPRLSDLDPNVQAACEFEWAIFAGESRLDPIIPEDMISMPEPGCACTARPDELRSRSSWILFAILILLRRRS